MAKCGYMVSVRLDAVGLKEPDGSLGIVLSTDLPPNSNWYTLSYTENGGILAFYIWISGTTLYANKLASIVGFGGFCYISR